MPDGASEVQSQLPELVRRQSQSPYLKLLGLTVEEARIGYCRVTCTVRQELIHEGKMMNGGVTATMADIAVAMALLADPELQIPVPTIQMSISYLHPARLGLRDQQNRRSPLQNRGEPLAERHAERRDGASRTLGGQILRSG